MAHGEWIPCNGACPDVAKDWKAGEYEIKFASGGVRTPAQSDLIEWSFSSSISSGYCVVAVRSANAKPVESAAYKSFESEMLEIAGRHLNGIDGGY